MTDPWAIFAIIDGTARAIALVADQASCEWLRAVISMHLGGALECRALGRAV